MEVDVGFGCPISCSAIPTRYFCPASCRQTALLIGLISVCLLNFGCSDRSYLPATGSDDYVESVSLWYGAVARMEVGEERGAEFQLRLATAVAPGEPAIWYNRALLALRRDDIDEATEFIDRALVLAPKDGRILLLAGHVERFRSAPESAESFYRQAIETQSSNPRALYALRQLRSDREDVRQESRDLMGRILALDPDNLHALLESTTDKLSEGEFESSIELLKRVRKQLSPGLDPAHEALTALLTLIVEESASEAINELHLLANILRRFPKYREDSKRLVMPPQLIAEEMSEFLYLPNPPRGPAPVDTSLVFTREVVKAGQEALNWIGAPILQDDGYPVWVTAGGGSVEIGSDISVPILAPSSGSTTHTEMVIPIDFDYDFRVDLAVAGPEGFRLLRQDESEAFSDVSNELSLSGSILSRSYSGGWAVDLDSEGDMDLVLSTPGGPLIVLRNNGDGSFQSIQLFEAAEDVKDAVWMDADADGDLDAFLLDGRGSIDFYRNEGAGRYVQNARDLELPMLLTITSSDLNYDGLMDLLGITADGMLVRITPDISVPKWDVREVASLEELLPEVGRPSFVHVETGDLDNNGTLDVLASIGYTTAVLLMEVDGRLIRHLDIDNLMVFEVMDLVGVGRLDLVGLDSVGTPVQMMNMAQNSYRSRTLRPRTADDLGDRRINSYGIGGTIELKAGPHLQFRPITGPVVHFGLGEQTLADVARIRWPNGVAQNVFDLESDQAILAREGLNASCPWLFTFDGEHMVFLEDFMMRSPLGFRISDSETMRILTTEDRIKIGGERLAPTDGIYDVRLAAELWETIYVDQLSLVAVDHPAGTEFYLNETFSDPSPSLEPLLTGPDRAISEAWDDNGRIVTDVLKALDGEYLRGFSIGPHLGQAEDHYVEIDLGPSFVTSKNRWLVAEGWLRAGNSTVSLAVSQAVRPVPPELVLEYPDADGNWSQREVSLGIPFGISKSLLIDLDKAISHGTTSRIRIRTNLEIYWDHIFWTTSLPGGQLKQQRLDLAWTDLRYRGFSLVEARERWTPEVPDYNNIVHRKPVWRELSGYYTRYGDVRDLISVSDNRYVIMNAGDELALHFSASEPPREGWVRDFILVGDGWTKDGGHSTVFSKTVLPLPDHQVPYAPTSAVQLETDPVYIRHATDWQVFHTRFVSPEPLLSRAVSH